MKKQNIINNAFTLIEVLVSITIFSIMLISIIWIYIISTDITLKSDINRQLQENLKNVSNQIAEDIRKEGIDLHYDILDSWDCNYIFPVNGHYIESNRLCTKSWNRYYLAKENLSTWEFIRTSSKNCTEISDHCVIAKWLHLPLTNSYVSIKELKFYLSNDNIPKVTINIVAQPAVKKWVKSELIKETKIIFQTTISERPF